MPKPVAIQFTPKENMYLYEVVVQIKGMITLSFLEFI